MIHIRLPQSVRREIRFICADKDITIQSYVMDLIQKDFEERQKKGGKPKGKKK